MNHSPEIYELQAFFGGTHTQLYPDEPEPYSTHRFESTVADEHFVCEILPGEGQLHFLSWKSGVLTIDLKLQEVRSLEISKSAGEEKLIGNIDSGELKQLFKLRVRPHVCIQWSSVSCL